MLNAEKLLGGMLRKGLRRSGGGLGSLVSGGAALGLVGIAWEAVEHLMQQSQDTPAPPGPPPRALGSVDGTLGKSMPPPPPSGTVAAVAPPAPSPDAKPNVDEAAPRADLRQQAAVLLIRAMIAAANADGTIDDRERDMILEKIESMPLNEEEKRFIEDEFQTPRDLQSIIDEVTSADVARQVYIASVLAIEVDSDEELDYLQRLAQGLHLDADTLRRIHEQIGVEIYL